MFDATLHRRVVLVALAALVAFSGAVAGASVTPDVSPTEIDRSSASMAEMTTADENVSVEFVYEGERLTLRQADNQTVHLKTNADPGTDLTVVLRENGNFVTAAGATVSENGTATATFDLRATDSDTEFTVSVREAPDAHADVVLENATAPETTTANEALTTSVLYEGERLVLRSDENQTVRVQTNADAGTELAVVVRSGGNFLKTSLVTVSEDGTATATFDMSDVAADTEFTALVREADQPHIEGIVANATASVVYDGEHLTLRPEANQTIRGEADADPGTEFVVRLRGGGDDPFLKTDEVTVSEDGTFVATFDLDDVTTDADFEVTIREGSTDIYRGEGSVVEPDAPFTTGDTTDGGNDGIVPGFGVPAALVALLAALAVTRQRGA